MGYARVLYTGRGDLCRNVYQQLSKLGSLELQAVLNKMLDEVATPIKFCQYKLHGPSGADAGLKVPDSPSGKLIQVWPSLFLMMRYPQGVLHIFAAWCP